jgi:hypothetical protein
LVSTGALGFWWITYCSSEAHDTGWIADLGITAMPLGNVLHELFPLLKTSWLDRLFQLPKEMTSLMRFGASANIGIRPIDEVTFDLVDDTPFISVCEQKRYLDYILIFYIRPLWSGWIDRDIDVKALPVGLPIFQQLKLE